MDYDGLIAIVFFIGVITGAAVEKHGLMLGARLAERLKDNLPLDDESPTDQDNTGD